MFQVLSVTLLLVAPLLAAPQFEDDHHHFSEEAEGADARAAWSEEEVTTKHLDLEDPTSWSASTEVLDENHAWFRRRRSLEEISRVDSVEEEAKDDLIAAESVLFMPSHIRNRKKLAHEECRKGHRDFATWRRKTNRNGPSSSLCNRYCCYPVAYEV